MPKQIVVKVGLRVGKGLKSVPGLSPPRVAAGDEIVEPRGLVDRPQGDQGTKAPVAPEDNRLSTLSRDHGPRLERDRMCLGGGIGPGTGRLRRGPARAR